MSMQSIDLRAEKRDALGTRACRRLRRDDRLPAVVYGHKEDALNVTLPLTETLRHLQRGAHLFTLQLDGATEQVLLKDVQYDHLGTEILHVDLFRVNLDEEITSEVGIHLVGEAKGVKNGGILTQMRDTIEVVCRVRDLPDEIRIDVSGLDVGDAVHISEVTLPDGVRIPGQEADFTVAMVAAPKLATDDEVAPETGAEPEIIGQKQTEDDTGEGAKSPNA